MSKHHDGSGIYNQERNEKIADQLESYIDAVDNLITIEGKDVDDIKKIDGVEDIEINKNEYTIKISDIKYVENVFKKVSKCNNVTKFVVEEPTLNEIFISKVGEAYEK